MRISQSIIKDMWKYKNDLLCGLVFRNKWIHGQFGKPSADMKLGIYFEYIATGALPKGDKVPEPVFLRDGETLSKPYQVVHEQVKVFNRLKADFGIEIKKIGHKAKYGNIEGTTDIVASWEMMFREENLVKYGIANNPENLVIIDLKYTGLIDDRKNPLGWHTETLKFKEGLILQPKTYIALYYMIMGYKLPFFFWIFDNKKPGNNKIIHVEIPMSEIDEHIEWLKKAEDGIQSEIDKGLEPKPEYQRCLACEFKEFCPHKQVLPDIINIQI